MATVTEPITLDKSINTTENPSRNIADVLAEELRLIAENILPPNAEDIAYDNTESGLVATNVQDAIDEVISSQADVIADTMADLTENKTATVTDGVADFETIDGSLVKSLVVEIEPSQSGSGTPSPSNIRPITGWTQEDVTVAGRNLLPNRCGNVTKNDVTVTKNNDGTYTLNGTASAITDIYINSTSGMASVSDRLNFSRDGQYLFSGITGGSNTTYRLYNAVRKTDGTTTYGGINDGQGEFDLAYNESVDIFIRIYEGYTCNNLVISPMIRLREYIDDTAFYPYIGKTYTTAFGQTVYGGTLDVLTGELTIDRVFDKRKLSDYTVGASVGTYTRYYYTVSGITPNDDVETISNIAPFLQNYSSDTLHFYVSDNSSNARIYLFVLPDTDGNTDVEVIIPLATPTTLSLTPQTVKSLVGENHIQASTGDVLQCMYSILINGDDLAQILGG